MNIHRFFPVFAVLALATIFSVGISGAQQNFAPNSFFSPPPPSLPTADIGDRPGAEGTGAGSNTNPIGMFASSPFTYLFNVNEGYNSNFYATHYNPTSTWFTNWQAQVNYKFGGPRLQLTSSLGGGVTYNYNISQGVQFNGRFTLAAVSFQEIDLERFAEFRLRCIAFDFMDEE